MAGGEVVHHPDAVALAQQGLDQVRADEPGPPGHHHPAPLVLILRHESACRLEGEKKREIDVARLPENRGRPVYRKLRLAFQARGLVFRETSPRLPATFRIPQIFLAFLGWFLTIKGRSTLANTTLESVGHLCHSPNVEDDSPNGITIACVIMKSGTNLVHFCRSRPHATWG